ncbi:MAG: hypothetical protein HQ575_01465 [Candidatus Omnitrophica bacterium]|nr:hypothetical protein [Candidatus Omnitrophota bacterium]
MKIVVFAYNFPHKKTQDFLNRLALFGIRPDLVIASPPVKLNLPKSSLEDKYRDSDLIDPRTLCEKFNFKYMEGDHNSKKTQGILKEIAPDIGIIAAARILKREIIETFKIGIVNFHPGLIPENRGLNAVKWAVFKEIPQGMTAHFIDHRVDAGRVIKRVGVPVREDDAIKDINLRIYETEVNELIPVIKSIIKNRYEITNIDLKDNGYHPPAGEEIDRAVVEKFCRYKNKMVTR